MCAPLAIAGVAMAAASMYANAQAASAVAKKRDDVMAAELTRQQGYDREAAAIQDQSQGRYQNFAGQQSERGQKLGDYFAQQAKALPTDAPAEAAPESSNVLVKGEIAKQKGKAAAYGQQQDAALGGLRSFGDLLGGITRQQASDTAQLGSIGSFMKGSQAVVPLELEAANSAGGGWRTAGSLLGLGGSALTSAGMSGMGPSWGGLFGGALPGVGGAAAGANPVTQGAPGMQSNPSLPGFGFKIGGA